MNSPSGNDMVTNAIMEKMQDDEEYLREYARMHSTGHDAQEKERKDVPLSSSLRRHHLRRFSATVSTEEVNKDDKDTGFYGPYAHIREKLDYQYHVHYKKDRQWFQDSIIEDLLEHVHEKDVCITPTEPWLLYTAGVQGAGKGFTIQKLVEEGRLPLLSYVRVDPDFIRRRLPEYSAYLERCPEKLDEFTRKESGYISEILVLAAMQAGRNVILDGALRDSAWWNMFFDNVRVEYKSFKIGLLHVTAPRQLIVVRTRKQASVTGRHIGESYIDAMLERIPVSVEAVSPSMNYFVTLSNGEELEILTESETWETFHANFLQTCAWQPGQRELGRLAVEDDDTRRASFHALTPMKRHRRCRTFSVLVSTEMNHRSETEEVYGAYSHIRKTLDYNYHSNYTQARQSLQDAIITDMLNEAIFTDKNGDVCTTPTEPWIVFTAGAMGAGKSWTMRKLVEAGRFPLLAFVTVDPDVIRRHLPEFHIYVEQSPELAGELTRKEAGFISEILTLAALQAGKNVLVDGSLRDCEWFKVYFARLRKEFKSLRLAILHVTAPREAVFQRAAARALETGRVVPKETLVMALEQVPKSVAVLAPLVDYFAELKNDPDSPDIELVTEGETWESFKSKWVQTCAWIPSRRKLLKSTKAMNAKLSLEQDMSGKLV